MEGAAVAARPADLATTPLQSPIVIEAHGLGKRFSASVVALEDASFAIRKSAFTSIVGPSGCGKSTLLRLVAGLIPRTAGSLKVHGEEVIGPRPDIGMMFQKPSCSSGRPRSTTCSCRPGSSGASMTKT